MFALKENVAIVLRKIFCQSSFLTFDPSFIPISSFFNLIAYMFEYATHGITRASLTDEPLPYVWSSQEKNYYFTWQAFNWLTAHAVREFWFGRKGKYYQQEKHPSEDVDSFVYHWSPFHSWWGRSLFKPWELLLQISSTYCWCLGCWYSGDPNI